MKEEDLLPYFAFEAVLDGLFSLVERIFAIEVKPADGEAEVWHKDVRFFNIYDKVNGQMGGHIASFYLDPYSQPADKCGGARWMHALEKVKLVVGTFLWHMRHAEDWQAEGLHYFPTYKEVTEKL